MSKKIKILAIIVLYICLIFINTKAYATTGTTTEETTRVRKEASTGSAIVVLISQGEEVEVVEESGEWYKVKYKDGDNTYTGYIRQDLLKLDKKNNTEETTSNNENNQEKNDTTNNNTTSSNENSQENKPTKTDNTVKEEIKENEQFVIKNNIEIKILPIINSNKIGVIEANTKIAVTEIVGKWAYVEANNKSGWVMLSKVGKEEEKIPENSTAQENDEKNTSTTETENNQNSKPTEKEPENNKVSETTEKKEETLYVGTETLNVREKADSNSNILRQLSINTKVTVVDEVDNTWSKVKVSGITGYVASKYLSKEKVKEEITSRGSDEPRTNSTDKTENNKKEENSTNNNTTTNKVKENNKKKEESTTKPTKTETTSKPTQTSSNTNNENSSSSKTTGADIVAYAKQYLGCKYVSGGTSPKSGFDCSGFTQYVYKHFGYSISRTSSAQRSNGTAVKKSNLKPGDIVCFSGHVGIYIGENQFIHAANPRKGVIITSLSNSYYVKNYITARRIL